MKKFALALVVAFALLPIAVPTSAATVAGPISKAAPETAFEPQTPAPLPWLEVIIKPIPRCSAAMGTACSPIGSTMACVDACNNRLSCTCINSHGTGLWGCSIEC